MFKRIKISLTEPKLIGQFIKDKKRVIWGYLLFLLLIITIPMLVKSFVKKEIDPLFKKELIKEFKNNDNDYNEITISDYKLIFEEKRAQKAIDPFHAISFNSALSLDDFSGSLLDQRLYHYNFSEDGIELYLGLNLIKKYSYQELELKDFNFNLPSKEDEDSIVSAFNAIYLENKVYFESLLVIGFYLSELFLLLFLILISTWIYKYQRPKLRARYRFNLTVYSYTIYLFFVLLGELFSIPFLKLLGILLAIIYLRMAYRQLIIISQIQIKEDEIE